LIFIFVRRDSAIDASKETTFFLIPRTIIEVKTITNRPKQVVLVCETGFIEMRWMLL